MAKRKFTTFTPRPKPRKRPRRNKKSLSKSEKRDHKPYNRQGRKQQLTSSQKILYCGYERKNNNYKTKKHK